MGLWAASDANGRFRFAPLEPGNYEVLARTADGAVASGSLVFRGNGFELRLGTSRKRAGTKRA